MRHGVGGLSMGMLACVIPSDTPRSLCPTSDTLLLCHAWRLDWCCRRPLRTDAGPASTKRALCRLGGGVEGNVGPRRTPAPGAEILQAALTGGSYQEQGQGDAVLAATISGAPCRGSEARAEGYRAAGKG